MIGRTAQESLNKMLNKDLKNPQVIKNKFGFYTLKKIPHKQELKKYYEKKYYQAEEKYSIVYTKDELDNIFIKLKNKFQIISKNLPRTTETKYSLLDIGAGEGWTLKYFKERKWDVCGIDFSSFGCRIHNPKLLKSMIVGDIDKEITRLIKINEKFDLIWLDNVLEHVIGPQNLLKNCRKLSKSNGLMVIEVPNDFSPTQKFLIKHGYIDKPYWVVSPDHISYFNAVALNKLCKSQGWENFELISDFPIDFFLFNTHTNYIKNKKVGKDCHLARTKIENFIATLSFDKNVDLCRDFAKLGLGRQIIGFYRHTDNE